MQSRLEGGWLPTEVPNFSSPEEAELFLKTLTGTVEIRHATYFGMQLKSTGEPRQRLVLTTYPTVWANHYFANKYDQFDPVVRGGLSGILPFDWGVISYEDIKTRNFFGEAKEFGVGGQGISFPIRGQFGDRALFSITSDLSMHDWRDLRRERQSQLMVLGYQFHSAIVRMLMPEPVIPQLGPREREVLAWAAEGKSIWETAHILNLSENTVAYYLKGAIGKMGTTNKLHAVAEAIRLQLL